MPHLVKKGPELFNKIVVIIMNIDNAITPYAMRIGLDSFETYLPPSNLSPRYSPMRTIGIERKYNAIQDKIEFGR